MDLRIYVSNNYIQPQNFYFREVEGPLTIFIRMKSVKTKI